MVAVFRYFNSQFPQYRLFALSLSFFIFLDTLSRYFYSRLFPEKKQQERSQSSKDGNVMFV